jgi:hypothetical protein
VAADVAGGRLFVTALGNKTLEVLDWNSGKTIKSIANLDETQGIVYRSDLAWAPCSIRSANSAPRVFIVSFSLLAVSL